MFLPVEKSCPNVSLSDRSILLYGASKIGKSVLASQFPDVLFIQTEPGLGHIEAYKTPLITQWEQFAQVYAELDAAYRSGTAPYKTIVIDTVDRMAAICSLGICNSSKTEDIGDLDWGKGWRKLASKMEACIYAFASLPPGLILISHSKDHEIECATGNYKRTVPNMQPGVLDVVTAFVDYILFCTIEKFQLENGQWEWRRVIKTKPSAYYEAGDRAVEDHRKLPETLPLEYAALKDAFDAAMLPFE